MQYLFSIKNEQQINNYDIENNECCICLNTEYESSIYRLKDVISTNCLCNGYFHKECLVKWLNKKNSCPICRSIIPIQFNNYYDLYDNNNSIDIISRYICLIQNIRIIVKLTMLLLIIQITLELYNLSIIYKAK